LTAVWILGDADDPHTDLVATKCQAAGAFVLVGTQFSAQQLGAIAYSDDREKRVFFELGEGSRQFASLWNRLKPIGLDQLSETDVFVHRERRDFLMSAVACFLPVERRLNDPWAQDLARMKPYQLWLAREVGLEIPKTIVTDDAERVLSFFGEEEATIYKPVTWLATLNGEVLFTNRIERAEISRRAQHISRAPGIYQTEVRKACEYRVTIVDDTIFPVRIYSQDRDDTAVDWRRNQFGLKYEIAALPAGIERMLFEMMKLSRLRFGAFDLIERPNGEFVFLEVNPAGNWLWLEERLNIAISDRIVAALLQ
jgi:glutathione synthase/RimK-type ligase-like ATP-grasp enzyme